MKRISKLPFKGTAEQEKQLKDWLAENGKKPGASMAALQKAQEIYGYLPIEVQRMVAEGVGGVYEMAKTLQDGTGIETRATILGHVQRGGNPTGRDRVFATLMGAKAVDLLIHAQSGIYVGIINEELAVFDIVETLEKTKHKVREDLYELNLELTDRVKD